MKTQKVIAGTALCLMLICNNAHGQNQDTKKPSGNNNSFDLTEIVITALVLRFLQGFKSKSE